MSDKIETIGNSVIQHGRYNDRIYLIKFDESDTGLIFKTFEELVNQFDYSKIFIKIRQNKERLFSEEGFLREAVIPDFYDKNDHVFMGKFLNKKREYLSEETRELMDDIIRVSREKAAQTSIQHALPDGFRIKQLSPTDASQLALLYQIVFDSYPFPVFDPQYILKTMQTNVVYFGCFKNDQLVAAASSEMDTDTNSVEMTDFATLPEFRGNNLASILLNIMEGEMQKRNIITAFTIARALSHGMNITFAKNKYIYSGTLINNTNISGQIESMNIWYKKL